MWDQLRPHFRGFPAQEKLARTMLQHGLRVKDGKVFCGEIRVADSAIARAAGVDRRVVAATVGTIMGHDDLRAFYERLQPTCHLGNVAVQLGWGVIEIIPTDAHRPGILAGCASALASAGIALRQVVADDPDLIEDPRGYIITDRPIPEWVVPRVRQVDGVKAIVLH